MFANLTLPWNRIVVLGFVLMVLFFTWLVLNKTRLGLNVRAVTQNRSMAACCGVPTGRVDMLAFGLGSGIAGLGGVALSQLGTSGRNWARVTLSTPSWWWFLAALDNWQGAWRQRLALGSSTKFLSRRWGPCWAKSSFWWPSFCLFRNVRRDCLR